VTPRAAWRCAAATLLALAASTACIVRMAPRRQLTGTCDGACAHYLACKQSRTAAAERACVADCHDVFADADSLRAFESLSCEDAIQYVDGEGAGATASSQR
jgi:hypothetical protein